MKLATYTHRDAQIFMVAGPVYTVAFNYLLFGKSYFTDTGTLIASSIITFMLIAAIWKLFGATAVFARNRFPAPDQILKRLGFSIPLFFLGTFFFASLIFKGYEYLPFLEYQMDRDNYQWVLIFGCTANVLIAAIHEVVYTISNWKNTLTETEELKKINLQTRLSGLKSQVNPHFLFNSLNSLSSLISENPKQAEAFLNEMSQTYRYLLRNNEQELTSLANELKFIHSYFHLLRTRYGEGIALVLNIDPQFEELCLPPLTLQLLVENAVKHNMILKDQPLVIEISTKLEGRLVVKNNLQKKIGKVESGKVGLANITTKYELMNQPPIEVHETHDSFTVFVPLIQPIAAHAVPAL